jgi:hypothetical protein
VVAVVAVGLIAAASAQATTPPRLTGEQFHEDLPTITALKCLERLEWTSTGTATGPYPGTYFETGTVGDPFVTAFKASFVIYSPIGIVKGTKTGQTGWGCAQDTDCHSAEECDDEGAAFNTLPGVFNDTDTYEATITIPGGGTFSDSGLFSAVFYHSEDHDSANDGFDAAFQSGLGSVEFTGPKTLEACRNGGHTQFGFATQSKCTAFARARAREACTFEKVAHGTAAFRAKYGIGPDQQLAMWNCVHTRIGF